jgi:hypothetical protein
MTYVNGRLVHDADSHLMELSDCLDPYFERRLLSRFHAMPPSIRARTAAPGPANPPPRMPTPRFAPAWMPTSCCARTTKRTAPFCPPTARTR